MVNIEIFIYNLKRYLLMEVSKIATSTPMISFMAPLISRALNNTIDKLHLPLSLIADKDGNIDITNILTEMLLNLLNTTPFALQIPVIGPIFIGEGSIKVNIPYTNKNLVLTLNDLENLKEILTVKN